MDNKIIELNDPYKPFLRWVGSKSRYCNYINSIIPKKFNTYVEPFLGSGALFFFLRPEKAVLSDLNCDLISVYRAVRDYPEQLANIISSMSTDKETYYETRSNRSTDNIRWAAEFIYLNRLCWNGLYRVNQKGEFNVPYGTQKGGHKIDTTTIADCSTALNASQVFVISDDFEDVCDRAAVDDFVFIDPPYVTSHNHNGFIEYNEKIFSWKDQMRLEKVCRNLDERGVTFLLTNANHECVSEIYDGFCQHTFSRYSTLAADKNFRKPTSELVITNYQVG